MKTATSTISHAHIHILSSSRYTIYPSSSCGPSSMPSGKPSPSGSLTTGCLKRPIATLSITSQELYTPVISRLLYMSVVLDVFGSVLQALIDSGSAINLIHDSVVAIPLPTSDESVSIVYGFIGSGCTNTGADVIACFKRSNAT